MRIVTGHWVSRKAFALIAGALVVALCVSCGGQASSDSSSAKPVTVHGIELPGPEKTEVKLGLPGSGTVGLLPQLVALKAGIYRKYGLHVKVFRFSGGPEATQALVAGQIDVADTDLSAMPTLATSTPTQFIFDTRDNTTDVLMTSKNVASAADLKGKSIAVSRFGSQSYAGALLALKSVGLTTKDVTITQVGNDSARLAALKSGSVAGSMQDHTLIPQLTKQGFHALVKLGSLHLNGGVIRSGLLVQQSFATKYPNTSRLLVAAMLDAISVMRAKPADDARYFAADASLSLADAREQVNDELATRWEPRDGKCRPEVLTFMKNVIVTTNQAVKQVDESKMCTSKFIDDLDRRGLQKALA